MAQRSSEKVNKGSNDYFLQRMLSSHGSQAQNTNQSIHNTETAESKVHFESVFSNHFSSHNRDSRDGNDSGAKNYRPVKNSISNLEGTSSFLAQNKHPIGFRTNITSAPLNNTQLKLLMQEKNQNFDVNKHLKELNQLHTSRSITKNSQAVPFRVSSKLGVSSFDISSSKLNSSNTNQEKRSSRTPFQNIM